MKPLSGVLIEIFSLATAFGMLLLFGFSNPLDSWIFSSLSNTHALDWATYLPGTWEAVDDEGNLQRITFPNCGAVMPTGWDGANSQKDVLKQGYQFVIGVRNSGPSEDAQSSRYILGRSWSTSYASTGYANAWDVRRADERLALVTMPKPQANRPPIAQIRDEIYLERVDENTLRSVSQQRIREDDGDVLNYRRIQSRAPDRALERPTSSPASCIAEFM